MSPRDCIFHGQTANEDNLTTDRGSPVNIEIIFVCDKAMSRVYVNKSTAGGRAPVSERDCPAGAVRDAAAATGGHDLRMTDRRLSANCC